MKISTNEKPRFEELIPTRTGIASFLPEKLVALLNTSLTGRGLESPDVDVMYRKTVRELKKLVSDLVSNGISEAQILSPQTKIEFDVPANSRVARSIDFYTLLNAFALKFTEVQDFLGIGGRLHSPGTMLCDVLGRGVKFADSGTYYDPFLYSIDWPDFSDPVQMREVASQLFARRDMGFREFCKSVFVSVEEPRREESWEPLFYSGYEILVALSGNRDNQRAIEHLHSPVLFETYAQLRSDLSLVPEEQLAYVRFHFFSHGAFKAKALSTSSASDCTSIQIELEELIRAFPLDISERPIQVRDSYDQVIWSDHRDALRVLCERRQVEAPVRNPIPDFHPLGNILSNQRPMRLKDKALCLYTLDALGEGGVLTLEGAKKKRMSLDDAYDAAMEGADQYFNAWGILDEIYDRLLPPDQATFTYSFSEYQLANSEGNILFENIGQMLRVHRECSRFGMEEFRKYCRLKKADSKGYEDSSWTPAESVIGAAVCYGFISDKCEEYQRAQVVFTKDQIADYHVPFKGESLRELRENLRSLSQQHFGCIPSRVSQHEYDDFMQSNSYCYGARSYTGCHFEKPRKIAHLVRIFLQKQDIQYETGETLLWTLLRNPELNMIINPPGEVLSEEMVLDIEQRYPTLMTLFFPERIEGERSAIRIADGPLIELTLRLLRHRSQAPTRGRVVSEAFLKSEVNMLLFNVIKPFIEEGQTPLMTIYQCGAAGPVYDMSGRFKLAHNFGHLVSICLDLQALFHDAHPARSIPQMDWFTLLLSLSPEFDKLDVFGRLGMNDQQEVPRVMSAFGDSELLKRYDSNSCKKAADELVQQVLGQQHYLPEHYERIKDLRVTDVHLRECLSGKELIERAKLEGSVPILTPLERLPQESPLKQSKRVRRTSLYQQLFEDLNVPTGHVFLALCALGNLKESRAGLKKFQARLAHLGPSSLAPKTKKPLKVVSDFIELHLDARTEVDFSDIGQQHLKDFLYQVLYREYAGDKKKMQSVLKQCQAENFASISSNPTTCRILDLVVPKILSNLSRCSEFSVPSGLSFRPHDHQKLSCVGALFDERNLIILGPGTGKTKTGVLIAESGEFEKVLWCTKASNRGDTVRALQRDGGGEVLDLNADVLNLPTEELKQQLERHRYYVNSYDTLWRVPLRSPDNYELLKKYVGRSLIVLDEGHLLDNRKSKRFQGVSGLAGKQCIVLTATPVQHRLERLASLLHLVLPERYSDPVELERKFRLDKSLALALYHRHSSVFSMDDVSLPFQPFSEISAKKQLSKEIPLVPKFRLSKQVVPMSMEHSRAYVSIVGDHPRWSQEHGLRQGRLRQYAHLRQLSVNPERLGLGEPLALIDGVKAIAVPAMQRGEKVLILGQSLNPLRLLHKDLEIQPYVAPLITGEKRRDGHERSRIVSEFELNKDQLCFIGQVQTVGTGYNFRGIKHVILIDMPKTTAEVIQAMFRHRRILSEENHEFALEEVFIHFLDMQLDERVVNQFQDTALEGVLEQGTLYSLRLRHLLHELEQYKILTSRSKLGKVQAGKSLKETVQAIESLHSAIERDRHSFERARSRDLGHIFYRYRSEEKEHWRAVELKGFVEQNLCLLGKPVDELHGALLPGPEALELPLYLEAGVPAAQVHNFECDPSVAVQSYCRQEVNRFGARYYAGRMEDIVPRLRPLDFLSIDSNSYLPPTIFKMLIELNFEHRVMILKNTLCQREQGEARDLLALLNGKREKLDETLFSLIGSDAYNQLKEESLIGIVKRVQGIEAKLPALAERLGKSFDLQQTREVIVNALRIFALHSPKIIRRQQSTYQSAKGSPFLSTFAVLEKPPVFMRNLETARALRSVILGDSFTSVTPPKIVPHQKRDSFALFTGAFDEVVLHRSELLLLVEYAEQGVGQNVLESSNLAYP